jgi:hypothetical protein
MNGLHRFNQVWPRAGGLLALGIAIALLVWRQMDPHVNLYSWLFWWHLPIIMVHEFEEYVFPGGFQRFFNGVFARSGRKGFPLDDKGVAAINMGAWGLILLGAVVGLRAVWLPVALVLFNLINVGTHAILFQTRRLGYNPGLFTGLFLTTPYAAYLLAGLMGSGLMSVADLGLATLLGGLLFLGITTPTIVRLRGRGGGRALPV